ncbi:MAG: asparagine synthase (glutamine-hydrolyzing) [Chitinophagaceae bacterium]|nr:asparagine synthase (glutamine-hydrolyzing) [Chitinophagaceae bacterium]
MCGIFGAINFNKKAIDQSLFKESLLLMKHRGPDNQSCSFYKDNTVAFGHVRLSIIDLTNSANQPMQNEKYCIVFNGEIYNYLEIREDLKKKDFVFLTDSDTEVILKAYEYYGEECVNKFNGMWSFVIYDIFNDSYFCSRDRFGVKPFNYYYSDKTFIFSSEIKSIINYDKTLRTPNYNSIGLYCLEGASSELTDTWFSNILRLQPGHNMHILNKKIKITKYYAYPNKSEKTDFNIAKEDFKFIFTESVKIRMRSDVPVGVTLSGGLDSSSIVSSLSELSFHNLNSYTASFPNYIYDEFEIADKVNILYGLNSHKIDVIYSNEEYLPLLKQMIFHLESGNLSPSIFPLWKVYERAKKDVTVILEGQGADELLAGYMTTFSIYHLIDLLKSYQLKLFFIDMIKIYKNYNFKESLLLFTRTYFSFKTRSILRKIFYNFDNTLTSKLKNSKYPIKKLDKSNSLLLDALKVSHQTTLSNLLHYGDAISMAFSIENRLPFLDYRLVDFAMKLPNSYLISDGKGKYIQRESLKDILPDYIYKDKRKLGFPSPIGNFLNNNKQLLSDILLSPTCLKRGLYDEKKLSKLINSDFEKSSNIPRFLYRLISVELWFQTFID